MLFCDLYITLPTTSVLKCDNVSALYIASNPVFHVGTKHIEVDYHFVREKVLNPDILIKYTHDQVAKILIKGLSSTEFQYLKTKLMVALHQFVGGVNQDNSKRILRCIEDKDSVIVKVVKDSSVIEEKAGVEDKDPSIVDFVV